MSAEDERVTFRANLQRYYDGDTTVTLRKPLEVLWRERKGKKSQESRLGVPDSICLSERQMGTSELCFRLFPNKPLSPHQTPREPHAIQHCSRHLGVMLRLQEDLTEMVLTPHKQAQHSVTTQDVTSGFWRTKERTNAIRGSQRDTAKAVSRDSSGSNSVTTEHILHVRLVTSQRQRFQ